MWANDDGPSRRPFIEPHAMTDPWDLKRFVDAQDPVWHVVQDELWRGAKRSHWMWFVFPQLAGLGRSATAARYAISGIGEAEAYLAHPLLRERLDVATTLMLDVSGRTATDVLGTPDDMKFRSSMTLFARTAADDGLYRQALSRFFGGAEDGRTAAGLVRGGAPCPSAGLA